MRKLFILLPLLALYLLSSAQYPGFTLVNDHTEFQKTISETAAKTNTITSDFTQEKNLSMLSEKIKSKGKFWFKKENRIRMEYLSPFQYIMVINKDRVTIRDGQKTNSMSVSSNRLFQQVNKIIIDCVQGSALNNTDFKTRVFGNSNNYLIEMKPISKSLKNLFESIVITLDKKDNSVSSINMTEKSGDNTLIRFAGKQMNTNIADEVFIIH